MPRQFRTRIRPIWFVSIAVAIVVAITAIAATIYGFMRRTKSRISSRSTPAPIAPLPVQGLTDAEAAARHTGVDMDALMAAEQKRFTRAAIRHNLFTWVNINLFTIAIIMLLLDSPLSTLGTLFVLVMNIVLNVLQETMTKKRLDDLVQTLRPKATVIREGKLKSIDSLDVVQGDVLAVGVGDSILVDGEIVGDGQIVVDEPHNEQDDLQAVKKAGDRVQANSYCVGGRALYTATNINVAEDVARQYANVEYLPTELTPLQQVIRSILVGLFTLSMVFGIILLINALVADVDLISDEFRNGVAIIIGAAPTSLFFIIIIHYVVGSYRMAEAGALVYHSQSMEAVASISTLCLSRRTLLQGMQVDLDYIDPPPGVEPLADGLVRRMLGDCLHSTPIHTTIGEMLIEALPGTARAPLEMASFLPVQGWSAVSFDEPDLRGVFVVGEPDLLAPYLQQEKPDAREQVEQVVEEAQRGFRKRAGKLFRRRRHEGDEADRPDPEQADTENTDQSADDLDPEQSADEKPRYWRRLFKRIRGDDDDPDAGLTDKETEDVSENEADEARDEAVAEDQFTVLFAYLPEVTPLYDDEGNPQLPSELIPLCTVHAAATLRPETRDTLREFLDAGIDVKVLSTATPEALKAVAKASGFDADDLQTASGDELAGMDDAAFGDAVRAATIIGRLTPTQKVDVVRVLQAQGDFVAMLGNDVSDLPAMRQASLRMALPSSSQAALMQADIALLEDSLTILPKVMLLGQKVVNGVLDTFKLNLSQVLSQLLLIIAVVIFQFQTFPYLPVQSGIISVFTITLPNILLVFLSSPGRMPAERLRRRLIHFTIPAGVTIALLALTLFAAFARSGHSVDYARLVVTYALLLAGWVRILFVQPPTRFWVGGDVLSGDRRVFLGPSVAALLLFVLLLFPRIQEWFKITWLDPRADYLLVAIAVVVWALIVRTVWRLRPLRRYGEVSLSADEEIA